MSVRCVDSRPLPKWVNGDLEGLGRCQPGCMTNCDCDTAIGDRCSKKGDCRLINCFTNDPNAAVLATQTCWRQGVDIECKPGYVFNVNGKISAELKANCIDQYENNDDTCENVRPSKYFLYGDEESPLPKCQPGCANDRDCAQGESCHEGSCSAE